MIYVKFSIKLNGQFIEKVYADFILLMKYGDLFIRKQVGKIVLNK